ncbi:MAG: sugar-binding protein, partial [Candidatus Wallbacteria bacterium]|nr:sugar-binding protein [Candidatus Wallbacteria bacterium]
YGLDQSGTFLFPGLDSEVWRDSGVQTVSLRESDLEMGLLRQQGYGGDVRIIFSDSDLFLRVSVNDKELHLIHSEEEIFKDDGVEIFIDSDCKGMKWFQKGEFQIVASPSPDWSGLRVREYFHGNKLNLRKEFRKTDQGYEFVLAIPRQEAECTGSRIGLTVVLHNVDRDCEGRLNWFFARPGTTLPLIQLEGGR